MEKYRTLTNLAKKIGRSPAWLSAKLLNDGEWHKTAEIADNLGLKDTRTKELLKELIALDKLIDNGKTKGKLYRLK